MQKYNIRYGGTVCGKEEESAIKRSVSRCVKTGQWQYGPESVALENELKQFLGVKYATLTTSGSCAGLLALAALELPKGSEVIISAVTFPTIFNIIIQCGLVPVVVDADIGSYTFNLGKVEKAITKKTGAIIAVHPLGNPVDMPKLMKMVRKQDHKIFVIEDNCDGIGTTINGKQLGSFGDISITSTHAAHIVSTMGVGGVVFTNNKSLSEKVVMYRDWGRQANINKSENLKWKELPKDYNPRFIYEKIGYNFQIIDPQSAMGRVQLKRLKDIKEKRQYNFDYLVESLSKHSNLVLPSTVKDSSISWFALPITYTGERSDLLKHLESNGIETRPMFSGNIVKHPAYKGARFKVSGKLENADYIMAHTFWIGVHPRMTERDRKHVVKTFNDFFAKHNSNCSN